MHRDISAGNIMLDEDGQGILNDWDHGLHLDPANEGRHCRTVSVYLSFPSSSLTLFQGNMAVSLDSTL